MKEPPQFYPPQRRFNGSLPSDSGLPDPSPASKEWARPTKHSKMGHAGLMWVKSHLGFGFSSPKKEHLLAQQCRL